MPQPKYFNTLEGDQIPLPVFFPDATRAVLKTLDSTDLRRTHTPGILVNTFHLSQSPGPAVIQTLGGIKKFMGWSGGVISDSGGFQVMSLAKTLGGNKAVTDTGVTFKLDGRKTLFTPEISITTQLALGSDMVVVLDDFTDPKSTRAEAEISVTRTLKWATECKKIFDQHTKGKTKKPYLLGVVQGGFFPDLRVSCTKELVDIGFDGLGFGGWPINPDGTFDYQSADIIRQHTPDDYFLYGLGVGKPIDIATLAQSGWHIFDCVLPTRDARHRRLYVWDDDHSLNYSFFTPDKQVYQADPTPISPYCDCPLCQDYSRAYLAHLFRLKETTALRLATLHNLRFYSQLMQKLRHE